MGETKKAPQVIKISKKVTEVEEQGIEPVEENEEKPVGAQAEVRYVVLKTKGMVDSGNGYRTTFKEGSVLSSLHHDIERIKAQGVKLQIETDEK